MDRWQEIQQLIYPYRVEWMDRKVKGLRADYRSAGNELLPLLGELTEEEKERQKREDGREAAALEITYRMDDMLAGRREFHVRLTDGGGIHGGDRNGRPHPWCPRSLYGEAQDAMDWVRIEDMGHLRMTVEERLSLRRTMEQDYLLLVEVGLRSLEEEIREVFRRHPIRMVREFRLTCGELMGEEKVVMQWNRE